MFCLPKTAWPPTLLGGIIRNTVNSTVKKVPLLGDIPLLGNLFKSTDKQKVQTELMVFLTPRVVHDDAEARKIRDQQIKELSKESQKGVNGRIPPPSPGNADGAGSSDTPRSPTKPTTKPPKA